jgi:phosphopantothenoylcysteine decarboxylase/phosphopantothenate--cysteine ligase
MKILVTAGPTREAIDPVRYISNRSSGRMGYAVAAAAVAAGHEVVLVSGPVMIAAPAGVKLAAVVSAADMKAAVAARLGWCEALVMCAAVADWRPKRVRARKIKKLGSAPVLELVKTADILAGAAARKGSRIFVGFAAETGGDFEKEADRKRKKKRCDMIVVNDVTAPNAGFDVETNRVSFVTAEGIRRLPLLSKREVGRRIVAWIEKRDDGRNAPPAARLSRAK